MSDNARKLASARKFSRTVHGMITRFKAQISKLEAKPEITYSNPVRIQAHKERFISLDSDFKAHHFLIIELVDEEDEETPKREQAILDDHENRMNETMDHLTQLSHSKSSTIVVAPPIGLETAAEPSWLSRKRLQCLESSLSSVKATVESLTLGPDLDAYLIQHLQEQVGALRTELSNVARDILSMEHEDRDLLEHKSNLDKAFLT